MKPLRTAKKKCAYLLLALTTLALTALSGCGTYDQNDAFDTEGARENSTGYSGIWAEGEIYWLYGGLILDITEKGRNMTIDATYTQAAPDSRVASFSVNVALTEIKDNSLTVEFEDDGWGNAGTLVLEFGESEINCEIKDTHYVGDEAFAIWGVTPGQYYLYRNDDAYEMLEYDIEEYYEWLEEYEDYEAQTPVYDTSTASGILESLGMTEEEFRLNCQPLALSGTSEEMLSASDLKDYPANYTGQYFYISDDYQNESGSYYYKPTGLSVDDKTTLVDGYTTYLYYPSYSWYEYILIFDMRDDIYSPTISKGDYISPYLVFTGVQTVDGIDFVCFKMLSVDK